MDGKTALILGVSGLTGNHCLNILLNSRFYSKIVVLVRSPLDFNDSRIQQAVIDFDVTSTIEKYYEGVDDVFCCLGTDLKNAGSPAALRRVDFHIPAEAANIAAGHGVKQFLAISTRGADNHSSDLYRRIKGEMEKGLEQFSFIALHVMRPSEVKDKDDSSDNSGGFFGSSRRSSNPEKQAISAELLAKAMVNAAQLGKEGTFYYSSSQIIKLSEGKDPLVNDKFAPAD